MKTTKNQLEQLANYFRSMARNAETERDALRQKTEKKQAEMEAFVHASDMCAAALEDLAKAD